MGLLGQALRHAAIVYGTEGTQVTGDGIEAYAAALEPVFIIGQQGGVTERKDRLRTEQKVRKDRRAVA